MKSTDLFRPLLETRLRFLVFGVHHMLTEVIVLLRDFGPRHRLRRKLRGQRGLRLNLGCGPKIKSGWLNIDLSSKADYCLDLRQPLPLPDGAAELILAEHFLEHLDYPFGADRFAEESFRILESGGGLVLSVPDSEEPLRAYRGVAESAYFDSARVRAWHGAWCRTPLEHLNYHFRQNAAGRPPHHHEYHHFAYDFETLKGLLLRAGFEQVALRDFDPDFDSEDRRNGSLRVIAKRP